MKTKTKIKAIIFIAMAFFIIISVGVIGVFAHHNKIQGTENSTLEVQRLDLSMSMQGQNMVQNIVATANTNTGIMTTSTTGNARYYFNDVHAAYPNAYNGNVFMVQIGVVLGHQMSSGSAVSITFSEGYGEGCFLGTSGEYGEYIASKELSLDYTCFEEPEGDSAYATSWIYVSTPENIRTQVKLTLTYVVNGVSDTQNRIQSDTYTFYQSVLNVITYSDFYETWEETFPDYVDHWDDALSYENTGFDFAFQKGLLVDGQYKFTLSIPADLLSLLKSEQRADITDGVKNKDTYTNFLLKIEQKESGTKAVKNSLLYGVNLNGKKCLENCLELPADFLDDGVGEITLDSLIGKTGDDTMYGFSAKIVKCVYQDWEEGFIFTDYRYEHKHHDVLTSFVESTTEIRAATKTLEAADELGLSEEQKTWLSGVAGVSDPGANMYGIVYYLATPTDSYRAEKEFEMPMSSAFSLETVVQAMYAATDFDYLSDFNLVHEDKFYQETEDGKDVYSYSVQERIVLTATGFTYDVLYANGLPNLARIVVQYADFNYKDTLLKIKTVDREDPAVNYTLNYYTTNVVVDSENITLTYRYDKIQENLQAGLGWILDPESLRLSIADDYVPSGITVEETAESIIVTCPVEKEGRLIELDMTLLADMDEDTRVQVSYERVELSRSLGNIVSTTIESDSGEMWYSDYILLNFDNFMLHYGDEVYAGVEKSFLDGARYLIPSGLRHVTVNAQENRYKLVVTYTYNMLFEIRNNYDDIVRYRELSNSSVIYLGGDFVEAVPEGYRVKEITSTSQYVRITKAEAAPDDYTQTVIQYLGNSSQWQDSAPEGVIPIYIEYTDKWKIVINYLAEYQDYFMRSGGKGADGKSATASFAEKKTYEGLVRVADYKDIYKLSQDDLKAILSMSSLTILGLANVDKINVTYDNTATYTVNLTYTYATLRAMDYDGNVQEIKIPLTSYAAWCENIGEEWSILFLNTSARQFFQYTNDVSRENLYGFFSVAVFEHQVSDLNYWFRNTVGDGYMTVYENTTVQGSALYRKLADIREKFVIAPLTTFVMGLSEIVNDDNKMLYSYFFYLDGSSTMSYLGENDADNAEDTDGALKNETNDVIEGIENWWNEATDSSFLRAVKIIIAVVAVLLISVGVFAAVRRIYAWGAAGSAKGYTRCTKK